jgi:hypothetical protein
VSEVWAAFRVGELVSHWAQLGVEENYSFARVNGDTAAVDAAAAAEDNETTAD